MIDTEKKGVFKMGKGKQGGIRGKKEVGKEWREKGREEN